MLSKTVTKQSGLKFPGHIKTGPGSILAEMSILAVNLYTLFDVILQDFKAFVDGSGDAGFIVFSLGSIVKNVFDSDLMEKIASVFNKLPHRVVWKHDGITPKNLGANTKVSPWIPQAALLGKNHVCRFSILYYSGHFLVMK